MLKEGWDVRNVTVIVGLRAYVSEAKILPEQTLGRGSIVMETLGRESRGAATIKDYLIVRSRSEREVRRA